MKRNPQAQLDSLLDGLGVDKACVCEGPKFFKELGLTYRKHFQFVQFLKSTKQIPDNPETNDNNDQN